MTLETRPASAEDLQGILELCRRALGWSDVSPRFLEWKHLESPFGPSVMWVAVDDERVVGFRAFLRWEFVGADGSIVRAARAVDTATDPGYRRQGLFRSLTFDALETLRADGVKLVWNTPNATSLSGYLSMGWQEVGRIPVAVAPASARFPFVVLTARRGAGRDAVPTSFGQAAWDVLGDDRDVDTLIGAPAPAAGLATHKTQAFLAWRYNNPALGYRVLLHDSNPGAGLVIFRLRRRGRAVEAVICDLFVPPAGGAGGEIVSALLRGVARGTAADYLIQIASSPFGHGAGPPFGAGVTRRRFVRLPQTGPVLACRPLDGFVPPALGEWSLTMGDVELL
jgi:GNAT superfamily N-acetyltransferase